MLPANVGIGDYFKTLKWMAITCLWIGIVTLPALLINVRYAAARSAQARNTTTHKSTLHSHAIVDGWMDGWILAQVQLKL